MSELLADARSAFKTVRISLAVAGALALIAGIVLLVWPVKSAVIVTGIFASYLIIGGLVYAGLGVFSSSRGGWARIGHIVLGLLYVLAGIIAFVNLGAAAATLAIVVVVFIGISWIFDGVVALTLLGSDGSRVWTFLYAVLSIFAGIYVLFNVLAAGIVLWIFLGISLVVLGVVQLVRAFTLGRAAKAVSSTLRGDAG